MYISQVLNLKLIYPQDANKSSNQKLELNIKYGISKNGTISSEWLEAIRYLRNNQDLFAKDFDKRKPTYEEILWAELIKSRKLIWGFLIDSLRSPFKW